MSKLDQVFVYASHVYIPNKHAALADAYLQTLGYACTQSRAFPAFHIIVSSRSYLERSESLAKALAALLLIPVATINTVPR